MKIIGAVLIFVSSILCSYTYEKKLKCKISHLEEAISFINYIRGKIEYFSLPINQIFENYENKTDFIDLLIATKDINRLDFDKETNHELFSFFSVIGNGYKKEQVSLCEYTSKLLGAKLDAIKSEYPNKTKIFRSMSLFISVSIIILLV